ncbi:MAG: hypothetical protein ABIR06_15780 [Cyclobacteriaceae bacterium]
MSLVPVFQNEDDPKQPIFFIQLLEGHYLVTDTELCFFKQINPAFALISLKDVESKKYVSEWLHSWQRTDNNGDLGKRGAMWAKHHFLLHQLDSEFQKIRRAFHHKDSQ